MENRAVLAATLLVLYFFECIRRVPLVLRDRSFFSNLAPVEVFNFLSRRPDKQDDCELEICIATRIAEKKLQWTRRMVSIIVHLLSIMMFFIFLFHEPGAKQLLSSGRVYVLGFVHFISLLSKMFPGLLNARTVDVWHSIVMAGLVMGVSPYCAEKKTDSLAMNALVLLLCSIANLKLMLCIFWSAAVTAMKICTFAFYLYEPLSTCSHIQLDLRAYTIEQVVVFCVIVILTFGINYLVEADVRHAVQAEKGRTQSSALSSLLDLMCDTVVELDSNLAFAGKMSAFATTLLLDGQKDLQGVKIETFMPDIEDRKKFQSFVDKRLDDSTASVVHITLEDVMGNHIRTEFFHVPFISFSEKLCHLIGIREHNDFDLQWGNPKRGCCTREAGLKSASSEDSKGSDNAASSNFDHPPALDAEACSSVPSRASSSCIEFSSGSEPSPRALEDIDLDMLSNAQVDFVLAGRLPVIAMSSDWAAAFGDGPTSTSLKKWIPNAKFFKKLERRKERIFAGAQSNIIEHFDACYIQPRTRGRHAAPGCRSVYVYFPCPLGRQDAMGRPVTQANYAVSLRVSFEHQRSQTAPPRTETASSEQRLSPSTSSSSI